MKKNTFKRLTTWLLTILMLLTVVPVNAIAAAGTFALSEEPVVVISASDYQQKGSSPKSITESILNQIQEDYATADGFLFGGDYYQNTLDTTTESVKGKNELDEVVTAAYPELTNRVYIQGNHDADSLVTNGTLASTGAHDTDNYSVYAINEKDYPWGWQAGSSYKTTCQNTANALDAYLDGKAEEGYSKPIFVITHVPLHYTPRTSQMGDGKYAKYLYDVLDEAGGKGLNIIFLFGHNHSNTYDDYIGGGQIYLAKGKTINVANEGSSSSYFSDTLTFTYMNCGYVGYIGGKAGTNVSMSVFEITDDEVIVKRYGTNGLVELKAAGKTTSGAPAADTSVVGTAGAVIELGESTEPDVPVDPEIPDEPVDPDEPEIPDEPEDPEEPEASGAIWRKASSIEDGKKYMLVNYGYNASGIETYAVSSSASPSAVTVKTDDTGAYIVNDDLSLSWVADANGAQYEMCNAETGDYLRAANYVYNNSGSDITVNQSTNSGSTYSNWSLETKNGNQVLAVRRATSSNYYPVRYTGSKFQSFNSSNVGSMTNWLTVFVETDENAHQHDYEVLVVAPTCTEDGYTLYTCECGASYTEDEIDALGHDYSAVVTDPTCEEDGYTVYTCECGDSYTDDVIEALGHDYTAEVVDPTCTEEGYTVYTCGCGDTYTEEIPATGHNYDCVITEADCVNDGNKVYTCDCGDTYTEVIPAVGHDYTANVTAPTCTEAGYTTYICHCGESYIADETAALGHTYTEEVDAPSCSKEGTVVYTCDCGDTYTEVIPATGMHEYATETVEPTCTESGYTTYICECGDTYTEEIPAVGHTYTAEVIDPTCTEEGYTVYTCECGESYTDDETEALGHSYTAEVVDPTCTEDGYTVYTCECGESYTDDETEALGHDYTAEVIAPTCTEEGYTVYTCECGESYTSDETEALGHTYTAEVVDPTCEEEGYTVYTCECGESYTDDVIEALGHDYTAEVVDPTCTEEGYTVYTCECGDSYTDDEIAALGHSYTAEEADGYMVYTCHCGDTYYEDLDVELSYVKSYSLDENNYVITLKSGNKYYAITHKNNVLSVARVTVSNNEVTSDVTDDMIWEYSGNTLSYEKNGTTYYLHAQYANNWWGWYSTPTLTISSTGSTEVYLSGGKLSMSGYYLRYSNNTVSLNWSGSSAVVFEETRD